MPELQLPRRCSGLRARALILALAGLAGSLAPPVWAQQEGLGAELGALLDYAREHSADYAAMRHEASAAAARVVPAGALPDPKLQIELRDITRMGEQAPTLNPAQVGSTRYLVMQDLPWFGKRALKSAVASAVARVAEGQARGSWAELAAQIRLAQAQRHFLLRTRSLNEAQLTLWGQIEQIARQRYANGLAAQQDVIRAQLEQTRLRNDVLMVEAEALRLDARLNLLLNRAPDAALAPAVQPPSLPPPVRMHYAALAARLQAANPQLQSEAARIEAAEQQTELTLRERYPDWSLGVAPIQVGSAVRDWELMLQVSIPLQQGARRGQEREAAAMLAAARAREQAASSRLRGELAQSAAAYEAAGRSAALLAGSLLPQARLSYQAARVGYENGRLDFANVLDAQREIRSAELEHLKAEAEQHMRLADIETLLGEAP